MLTKSTNKFKTIMDYSVSEIKHFKKDLLEGMKLEEKKCKEYLLRKKRADECRLKRGVKCCDECRETICYTKWDEENYFNEWRSKSYPYPITKRNMEFIVSLLDAEIERKELLTNKF